jgi:hypothetical protein
MNYSQIERDFIERTLTILDQYDTLKRHLEEPDQYEVTLLINCLLGLLVFPQQLAHNRSNQWLTGDKLEAVAADWGLAKSDIIQLGHDPKTKVAYDWPTFTLRNLIRALRNAVAHNGFTATSDGQHITHIEFTNRDTGFKMRLSVQKLRNFTRALAKSALEHLSPQR